MPSVAVVGSINLDLVATVTSLPEPGETLTSTEPRLRPRRQGREPGGGGRPTGRATCASSAPSATTTSARQAVAGLRGAGVDLSRTQVVAGTTGIALIVVDEAGDNQIVVVPGANHALDPGQVDIGEPEALVSQLEVRDDAIQAGLQGFDGFFCLNAAPAREVAPRRSSSAPT